MKYLNPERICKYQNKKALLEFNDKLYIAEKDNAGEVHSNYSKIKIVAINYSKGKKEDAVEAHFNLDPSKIKLIENKLNRFFPPIFEEKGNNESELIIGFGKYKNKLEFILVLKEYLLKYAFLKVFLLSKTMKKS